MSKSISPNQREILSARSTITGQQEYLTSTNGVLNTNSSGGSGGTQYSEGTTTSPATGNAMLGRYESAPSGVSTDGGLYAPLMDNFHQLKVVPVGTVTVASLPVGSNIIGKVGIDQTTPGTTNAVSLPGGSATLVDATANPSISSTGSFSFAYNGTTWDRLRSSPGVTGARAVGGFTASGSSLAIAPITGGGLAKTANPTAVSDGQVVNSLHDKLGKQVVVGSIRDLKVNQITTISASTSETTVLTAVASTFLDVYGVIVVNSSATATNVSFKDATAGTTRFNIYVPAGETRGFMLPESGAVTQATVNNNWTATSSASISSLIITMLAVKNT